MLEAEKLRRRVFCICKVTNFACSRTERRRVVITCPDMTNLHCSRTESRRVVITHRSIANLDRSRTESRRVVITHRRIANLDRSRTEGRRVGFLTSESQVFPGRVAMHPSLVLLSANAGCCAPNPSWIALHMCTGYKADRGISFPEHGTCV